MIYNLSICDTSSAVRIIYIVKVILTIVTIATPIALILSCMMDGVRAIISKDGNIGSMLSNWSKRIIAALIIFFIPNFVFLIGRISTGDTSVKSCYNSASLSRARSLEAKEKARSQAAINAWKQEQEKKRKEAEEKRKQEKEQKEREKQERIKQRQKEASGDKNYGEDEYSVGWKSNGNNVYNVSLGLVDTTKYAVKVTSGIDGSLTYKSLRFNKAILSEVDELLRQTAIYVKNSPYAKYLQTAGAYVNKGGYHGMGLAIDIFNRYKYKYEGLTYTPYGKQGSNEWYNRYKKFICNVCKGDETCKENINYHIYHEIWEPKGWCWGGNWPINIFDPMHFERTNKGCNTAPKNRITPKKCGITVEQQKDETKSSKTDKESVTNNSSDNNSSDNNSSEKNTNKNTSEKVKPFTNIPEVK